VISAFRQVVRRLGKSGVSFLVILALYLAFYFTGRVVQAFLTLFVLVPLGAFLTFRALRFIQRHALWSVRNRLLFVYGLIGVLPILLLLVLVGLSLWGLTNDLAVYLATSALERKLDPLNGAVESLSRIPSEQRGVVAADMQDAFAKTFPGVAMYIHDQSGDHRYPLDSPEFKLDPSWRDAHGLLFWRNRFYGWSLRADGQTQVSALAPLSSELVENLVPNLGVIALIEVKGSHGAPELSLSLEDPSGAPDAPAHLRLHLPPAVSTFDIPVFLPSTVQHYHFDMPNRTHEGVLWVYSRPSAVLSSFFSKSESLRGTLAVLFVTVVILFLVVEAVAVTIGVSLSHRLTTAVNQLYEGTRRVLLGDFKHRIPARDHDQLGDLSESFNQMTGNLERLFSVEKEKERLQTELEIAREVQNQLYPKEAPPMRGLKLTVCNDSARMVSGDYYDYQEIAGGKMAFAIGDVAGKGISAALLMATIQAGLRAQISLNQPGVELCVSLVVSRLNKQVFANTAPEKYTTFFFATFDESSRTLTYTNAGHLSPLLFRGNGDVQALDSNGTIVGAFPGAIYGESTINLGPGDLLLCYTDGITEPENPYGEMFGEERLIDLVKKHSRRDDREILQIILEAVRSWTGSPELQDDMTLLLAREVRPV
jgi:sigma-B regulation protein RsbU (phosphoserine phosphatase)